MPCSAALLIEVEVVGDVLGRGGVVGDADLDLVLARHVEDAPVRDGRGGGIVLGPCALRRRQREDVRDTRTVHREDLDLHVGVGGARRHARLDGQLVKIRRADLLADVGTIRDGRAREGPSGEAVGRVVLVRRGFGVVVGGHGLEQPPAVQGAPSAAHVTGAALAALGAAAGGGLVRPTLASGAAARAAGTLTCSRHYRLLLRRVRRLRRLTLALVILAAEDLLMPFLRRAWYCRQFLTLLPGIAAS